jgi:hypothetical protein
MEVLTAAREINHYYSEPFYAIPARLEDSPDRLSLHKTIDGGSFGDVWRLSYESWTQQHYSFREAPNKISFSVQQRQDMRQKYDYS